jgi:hypothetical protein
MPSNVASLTARILAQTTARTLAQTVARTLVHAVGQHSARNTRITVDLGDRDLYEAMHIIAVKDGTSLREVVVAACRSYIDLWLRDNAVRLGGHDVELEELHAQDAGQKSTSGS